MPTNSWSNPLTVKMAAAPSIDVPEGTEFVTLEGIPVLNTGVAYPASTGPFSVTSSMLQEVLRSQDDPHIVPPRIKIAHADNPIDTDLQSLFESVNAERDASEPALGTIINMRVSDDGQTLIGDWFGLPAWLAAILESAYPARSIEGGAWKNPANDKEYDFCLTAVSLLGVVGPGCTSLADLQELFSKEGPKVTVIEMEDQKVKMGVGVALQINVEDIRRAFYDQFAQGDRYWWWDRELLIDPNEMIVCDPEEDQLYKLPFDISGAEDSDGIVFGDPSPIKIKYVPDPQKKEDVKAERLIAPQLEGAGTVLAVNHNPPRDSERNNRTKETKMDITISALRERLNLTEEQLPDDATEEQVFAAIGNPVTPDPDLEPGEGDDVVEEPEVQASQGVTLPPETLAQLQADAAAGREARTAQVNQDRETFMSQVVRDGKIPPSARAAYLAQLNQGGSVEVQTRSFLEGLAVGLLPTGLNETGGDTLEGSGANSDYISTHLSPDERAAIEASASGTVIRKRIVTEA